MRLFLYVLEWQNRGESLRLYFPSESNFRFPLSNLACLLVENTGDNSRVSRNFRCFLFLFFSRSLFLAYGLNNKVSYK